MTDNVLISQPTVQQEVATNIDFDHAISLAERLDFLDIQILRKFYVNGKTYPFDSQSQCLPILYGDMKANHKIKIGVNAFRYRLNNLVKLGLLERVLKSNPAVFTPTRNREPFVKTIITKFFLINGLVRFLE